jgi:hypothetical protein
MIIDKTFSVKGNEMSVTLKFLDGTTHRESALYEGLKIYKTKEAFIEKVISNYYKKQNETNNTI